MSLSTKRPKRDQTKEVLLKGVTGDEGVSKMNVDIPRSFYKKMKQRALNENKTLSEITRQLWADYLSSKIHPRI